MAHNAATSSIFRPPRPCPTRCPAPLPSRWKRLRTAAPRSRPISRSWTERSGEGKKLARFAPTLPEKLERQCSVRVLEAKRDEAWRAYDQASRESDRQKDELFDEIGRRLEQGIEHEPLFALRWTLA